MLDELGIYKEEARFMTPEEFATKHNSCVRKWGKPPLYEAVEVLGTDYLWKDGIFDGWNKSFSSRIREK